MLTCKSATSTASASGTLYQQRPRRGGKERIDDLRRRRSTLLRFRPQRRPEEEALSLQALLRQRRGLFSSSSAPSSSRTSATANENEKNDGGEPDFITRIFGGIFGKAALDDRNPGGMRRLEGAALAEQYPATVDEWADALPGDCEEIVPLRRLLKNTRLEKEPLELAFDTSRDGWSCESFLAKVATRGANVVVAETEAGAVIGGYAPRSWLGLGEEKSAMAAFLFTWPEGGDLSRSDAIKLPKVGGAGLALIDRAGVAIQFGAEGLIIPLSSRDGASERMAKCRLGTYYAKIPSSSSSSGSGSEQPQQRAAPGGRSLFSPREKDPMKTELVSLKVFVARGAAEAWDLDGVVWKTGGGGGEGEK